MKKHIALMLVFCLTIFTAFSARSGVLGDVDNDGKIGLQEAVNALQVTSGMRSAQSISYIMMWKGNWSADQNYEILDAVHFNGSSYICLQNHTSSPANQPPNPPVWGILALKGDPGPPGPAGAQGPAGVQGPQGFPGPAAATVTSFSAPNSAYLASTTFNGSITDLSTTGPPVVNFSVADANGSGIKGLGVKNAAGAALNNLRFAIAKLVPGTNGSPDQWVSYMVTDTARPGIDNTGSLIDNGDGTYRYTFAKDLRNVPGVTYEPNLTHRLAIQVSGALPGSTTVLANPVNMIYDFVPAGGQVTSRREIVATAACNECHGKLAMHGGGRVEARFCVVCHTDQLRIGRTNTASVAGTFTGTQYIADGEVLGNFVTLIHKIHMGGALAKSGYNYAGIPFNGITYPQDQRNCRKCHKGDTAEQLAATPQGNNWKTKPSRVACGACHDNVDFATGANHMGGPRADDAFCALCHDTLNIELVHVTENATPNNPSVPTGAVNFTYEIADVAVNAANQAVVRFRILKDGTPVAFDGSGANPLTGFMGGPAFLLAFADGADTAVDYNNKGNGVAAAQPVSVSLADLLSGTRGTLGTPDANGYYTATIGTAAYAGANFPAGARMRAVALHGYFTQVYSMDRNGDGVINTSDNLARPAIAAWKGATGDAARREVTDSEKCARCHEWFVGHGGLRVKTVAVCVMCHNPNLTSSGRSVNVANLAPEEAAKLAAAGYDAANALSFPEIALNFKDLIHGIHAAWVRSTKLDSVRDRNGGVYYDFSRVTFPGVLKNCETCHIPGTYGGNLPAGALLSTTRITGVPGGQDATPTAVKIARQTINATDWVTSPIAASCMSCHDGTIAQAHMQQNGSFINAPRSAASVLPEQCLLCHGAGRLADVRSVHAR